MPRELCVKPEDRIDQDERFRYISVDTLLAESLYQPPGIWAMMSAYFDESGSNRLFVVAGLVAPAAQWSRFDREWAKILKDEGIQRFHMVDCAHGRGEFVGWPRERKHRIVVRLINLMKRRIHWRVWTAFVLSDYHAMVDDEKEKYPYGLCAMGCASRLRKFAVDKADDCFIRYAFERGGKGSGKAFQAFDQLLEKGEDEFYRMHSLSKTGKDCLPLQAADMHAYEIHKYFLDQIEETNRPLRKSLEALLSIPEAGGGGYLLTTRKFLWFRLEKERGIEHPKMTVDPLNAERRVFLKKRDGIWDSSVYFEKLGTAIKPPPGVPQSTRRDR